jgi:hypothetical protein
VLTTLDTYQDVAPPRQIGLKKREKCFLPAVIKNTADYQYLWDLFVLLLGLAQPEIDQCIIPPETCFAD